MGRLVNIVRFARAASFGLRDYKKRVRRLGRELTLAERARWLHETCQRGLHAIGVRWSCHGPLPTSGLLVCNHLGYLDILLLSAIHPCVFVSKDDVESWPVFGKYAKQSGTIFIDRSRRGDTARVSEQLQLALREDVLVVLFPEGTSSDGSGVLSFHSSLFEPAVLAQEPITAAHISYSLPGGDVGREVAYWGDMTIGPHFLHLMKVSSSVSASLTFAEASHIYTDRKQAARDTYEQIARMHADFSLQH